MKIALCLLTCDRPELTARTVKSMQEHLPLEMFELFHGDDCSVSARNETIALEAGFRTVVKTNSRAGVSAMWRSLIERARKRKVDAVLMMENDWEWVRTLRFEEICDILEDPEVYYIRFFGVNKERGGRPCGSTHAAKGFKDPNWRPYRAGWEIGDIHWGYPPNVTRLPEAVLLSKGTSESQCRTFSGHLSKLCVRPLENYVFHIGEDRTKGFRA